ncbi:MAG: CPBP family intramembrane metalloprotease [Firmicutes bacterium]|nr:CPBP family intramembrane metalloprotease [Bacillota bacterium]
MTNKPLNKKPLLNKNQFNRTHGAAMYCVAIISTMAVNIVATFIWAFISMRNGHDLGEMPPITKLYGLIFNILIQVGFISAFFLFVKSAQARPRLDIKFKISPVWYISSFAFGFVSILAFMGISFLFAHLLNSLNLTFADPFIRDNISTDILMVFAVVIMAPIGEELIFRGGLLSGLRKKLSPFLAALASGALFSLMHMTPQQTVYQFFLGFAAAYLTMYSGSVIPAILFHAASNLFAVLGYFVKPVEWFFDDFYLFLSSNLAIGIPLAVVAAAAGVAFFIFVPKLLSKWKGGSFKKDFCKLEEEKEAEQRRMDKELDEVIAGKKDSIVLSDEAKEIEKLKHQLAIKPQTTAFENSRFFAWIFPAIIICLFMWFVSLIVAFS